MLTVPPSSLASGVTQITRTLTAITATEIVSSTAYRYETSNKAIP